MTPPDDTSAAPQQGKAHPVRRFSRRPQQQENRDSAPDSAGNFQRNNRNPRGNQSHHGQGNKNNRFNKRNNNQHRQKEQGGNQREQNTGRAYVPVGEPEELTGLLEITNKGYGFIRVPDNNWAPSDAAVYVSADVIAEHHLRPFVQVTGMAQKYERGHQLISVLKVNGETPEEAASHPHFEDLKAVNPTQRLSFATAANRYTTNSTHLNRTQERQYQLQFCGWAAGFHS